MQDGIIKGVGNSRYLKSVPSFLSLYPTYEAFCEALIAGTLPIDLNGINEAGWTQTGTPLNKASLLKDTTAEVLGLTPSAVPDDALAKIKELIDAANANANSKARIQTGSYIGTGTFGPDNPCSLTFDFVPELVIVRPGDGSIYQLIGINGTSYINITDSYWVEISWNDNIVSWYNRHPGDAFIQLNTSGKEYFYFCI